MQEAEKNFDRNFPQFKSLASNKPLENKLKQFIDLKKIPTNTLYRCGLVSLDDGLYNPFYNLYFNNNLDFVQAILASASTPIIWSPIPKVNLSKIKKAVTNCVDRGLRNISPLGDVVKTINSDSENVIYEVIIINCNSGYVTPTNESWNIGDIALRALDEKPYQKFSTTTSSSF